MRIVRLKDKELEILGEAIDYLYNDLTCNPDLCFPDWKWNTRKKYERILEELDKKLFGYLYNKPNLGREL